MRRKWVLWSVCPTTKQAGEQHAAISIRSYGDHGHRVAQCGNGKRRGDETAAVRAIEVRGQSEGISHRFLRQTRREGNLFLY